MTTEQWGYRWDALIHVYVKNQKIYQCPSHTRDTSVSSYGINLNLGWRNYPTSSPIPIQVLTLADTKSPASLVLLYDSETEGWARAIGNGNGHYYFYYKPSNYFSGGRKHSGGDNICFVDGHVKWYRTNDLSTASGDLIITWNGISFEPSL
jgi:prepilin-type processing-associated H-X9-DG protein